MALLRLPCCPPTPYLYSEHQAVLKTLTSPPTVKPFNQSNHINNATNKGNQFSPTLTIRPNKKSSQFVFHFSSAILELQSKTQGEEREEEFSKTRLLATNVPWTCTTEDIRTLFEKFGTVVDVELSMYDKTRNRGLAFVTMGSPEEALTALNNLDFYEFEGRSLKLYYAKLKKKKPLPSAPPRPGPTFNLFVANLPFEARAKDLREFFIAEGANVVSADIVFHDNPRKSSGYGFVAFSTKKEADEALSTFQGKVFMGRPLRVARSRQFVKPQTKEGLQSDETPTDLGSGVEQADTAD